MRRRLAFENPLGSSPEERRRQEALWARALARRDAARAKALGAGPQGVQACQLPMWRTEALRRALAADSAVQQASLIGYDIALADGRRFELAMLCLRLDVSQGVQEPEIQDVYAQLMARVATPLRVAVVQSWWSTEAWPEWLVAHEHAHSASVLKPPSS